MQSKTTPMNIQLINNVVGNLKQ